MTSVKYNVISTGSKGNAVIIEDKILIDCGVNFKMLKPYYQNIKLVLLTHIHGDHFCKSTIKKLAAERPTLRFACGKWLVEALVLCGVEKSRIDVLNFDTLYGYGICNVSMFPLAHNVPNAGYKLNISDKKIIYATDTNNLNGVFAKNYDLYMIEANYEDSEIKERIDKKEAKGEYAYERQVLKNHLSLQKCNDFIYRNIGVNGEIVYMHCHEDKKNDNNSADCKTQ